MIEEKVRRAGGEARNTFAVALRIATEEMVRQQGDVLAAFAQRRKMDFDGIQAKKQILAETTRGRLGSHICVGGRQNADVHSPGRRRADALEFAGFQHPQKLGLQIERDVGDLVQKKRAALGKLKTPDTVVARVGEGAFHMAEELAFEQALGKAA